MRVHKVAMWSFFRHIRRSANVFVQIRNHIARKLHCLSCMCSFTATVCSSRGGVLRHISVHGVCVIFVWDRVRVRVRVWFIRTSVVRSKTKQIGWKTPRYRLRLAKDQWPEPCIDKVLNPRKNWQLRNLCLRSIYGKSFHCLRFLRLPSHV